MHALLKSLFNPGTSNPQNAVQSTSDNDIQLAAAVLLVEVIRADSQLDEEEVQRLLTTLKARWKLSQDDANVLQERAHSRSEDASDLYQFTRLLGDNWGYEERVKLITNMWHLAYSDNHLAPEEEALIRKVAGLLYVSHSDYIRAKLKAVPGG